jgi:hypothetical protein
VPRSADVPERPFNIKSTQAFQLRQQRIAHLRGAQP